MLDSDGINEIRKKAQVIVGLDVRAFLLMIKERMEKMKEKINGN